MMQKHIYQHIKGFFNWPELYARAVRMSPKEATFVEIGCFRGKSTSCLAVEAANSGKAITIYAVDLWEPERKIGCTVEEFMANVSHVVAGSNTKVIPIRGDSVLAAAKFKDKSVYFVWVDGNHSYPGAFGDICAWWPKLQDGGWMGGDDLIHGGVRKSVEQFFGPELLPGDRDLEKHWVRHQSATCHHGKDPKELAPQSGGWTWWARAKGPNWTPPGLMEIVKC